MGYTPKFKKGDKVTWRVPFTTNIAYGRSGYILGNTHSGRIINKIAANSSSDEYSLVYFVSCPINNANNVWTREVDLIADIDLPETEPDLAVYNWLERK